MQYCYLYCPCALSWHRGCSGRHCHQSDGFLAWKKHNCLQGMSAPWYFAIHTVLDEEYFLYSGGYRNYSYDSVYLQQNCHCEYVCPVYYRRCPGGGNYCRCHSPSSGTYGRDENAEKDYNRKINCPCPDMICILSPVEESNLPN